nr:probable aldehyde oxidase 4 [Aegilops tauschii subsp. strangulata]
MSGFHGSQCGFCTPGMCMSIFTSLANADKSKKPEPRKGFSKLTVSEAERAFSGNMCRCTGYRPIACKSFVSDVDLEDLGLNIFWKKGDKDADVSKLPAYTLGGGVCTFPDFLKSEIKSSLLHLTDVSDVTVSGVGWYHPKSIGQYYDLLNSGIFSDCTVKVVVGNTSSGVKGYKDRDLYNKYIDIGDIPELSAVWKKDSGFEIGAATPISKTIEILEQEARSTSCANGSVVFRKLAEHMSKVATPFVRNTASLGGNIILAQKYPFPSDIATILLGAASTVRLQVYSETLEVTFEEFLEQPPLDPSTLLLSIFIPHWASDSQKESKVIFETYRAAPRPLGNVVSYVTHGKLRN